MIYPVFCLVLYTIHAAIHIFLVWNLRGAIIIPFLEGQKTHRGVEKHALGDTSKGLNLLMSRVRFCPWNIRVLPLFSALHLCLPLRPLPFLQPHTAESPYLWLKMHLPIFDCGKSQSHPLCDLQLSQSYVSRYHTRFPSTFEKEQKAQKLMALSSVYSYVLSQASLSQTS